MEQAIYKVLIAEDDTGIADAIRERIESWGMRCRTVENFRCVLEEFTAWQPHLVLLDIALPFYSGYHWCSEIRRISKTPILFISSASDNMNIVTAIELGADDFIAKPFDLDVLTAKIQALLRRTYDFGADAPVLAHRGAFLNTGDGTLLYGDTRIPLTRNEYCILQCLMENKGRTVSRDRLMERLWRTEAFVDENTLTVNISRLRRKLEAAGLHGYITTKVGVGYVMEEA